jgi:hypothetical protein
MNVANFFRQDAEGAAIADPQATSMEEHRGVLQKLWWEWKGILLTPRLSLGRWPRHTPSDRMTGTTIIMKTSFGQASNGRLSGRLSVFSCDV